MKTKDIVIGQEYAIQLYSHTLTRTPRRARVEATGVDREVSSRYGYNHTVGGGVQVRFLDRETGKDVDSVKVIPPVKVMWTWEEEQDHRASAKAYHENRRKREVDSDLAVEKAEVRLREHGACPISQHKGCRKHIEITPGEIEKLLDRLDNAKGATS